MELKNVKNEREFERAKREIEDNRRKVGNYKSVGWDPEEKILGWIALVVALAIMILAGCSFWILLLT